MDDSCLRAVVATEEQCSEETSCEIQRERVEGYRFDEDPVRVTSYSRTSAEYVPKSCCLIVVSEYRKWIWVPLNDEVHYL